MYVREHAPQKKVTQSIGDVGRPKAACPCLVYNMYVLLASLSPHKYHMHAELKTQAQPTALSRQPSVLGLGGVGGTLTVKVTTLYCGP